MEIKRKISIIRLQSYVKKKMWKTHTCIIVFKTTKILITVFHSIGVTVQKWVWNSYNQLLTTHFQFIHSIIPPTASWKASHVNRSANFCVYHVANWAATRIHSDCIPILSPPHFFLYVLEKTPPPLSLFLKFLFSSQCTHKKKKKKKKLLKTKNFNSTKHLDRYCHIQPNLKSSKKKWLHI
jgi:hypothetical protein